MQSHSLGFTLFWVVAVSAITLWFSQSNLVAPSTAPTTDFSSAKALELLDGLLKENRPHPAGSAANAVIRDRIVQVLKAAGYEPEIQAAFQCESSGRSPACTQVENIIAVHKGTGNGEAVLATAHYDSVPAGPGASDDGAGTAVVLELAKAMASRQTRNDFIFLISDGEETGLRGAYAFAERHPLMKTVRLVVNVEARGASGPSMMFETGAGNEALIDLYSRTVAHPVATSLIYEVYKLLPNDTDFSVYRRSGLTGFNFAFSNSASLYHSERDNVANLDRSSLQHHGDNVFALASALSDLDLGTLKSSSDASYFDIFGRTLVAWPSSLNVPMAAFALLALAGLAIRHRGSLGIFRVLWALLAIIAIPVGLYCAGWLLSIPLGQWPGVHPLDHPAPEAGRFAIIMAGAFVATMMALVMRRAGPETSFIVIWLFLAMVALVMAVLIPGASFLLVLPVLVAAATGWASSLFSRAHDGRLHVAALAGVGALAFFWMPYVAFLESVLGFGATQFKILILFPLAIAFAASLAAHSLAKLRLPAAFALAATAIAGLWASQLPAYAANHPRGVNLIYYGPQGSVPSWLVTSVGAPDEAWMKSIGFANEDAEVSLFGVYPVKARIRPAEDAKLPPPQFIPVRIEQVGSQARLTGFVKSAREGIHLGLGIKGQSSISAVRVGDLVADAGAAFEISYDLARPDRLAMPEPVVLRLQGVGTRFVPVEITFAPGKSASLVLYERSELPEGSLTQSYREGRPADAAPVQFGDSTILAVTLDLDGLARQMGEAVPPQ